MMFHVEHSEPPMRFSVDTKRAGFWVIFGAIAYVLGIIVQGYIQGRIGR